ncbi:paramyosin, short form-like [Colletes gigas]|uniref:paramyosin, short form-like n=1 Tax=Colletes gigas TaxID=935657 RepID=UPI001C9AB7B3|nr:paramyosin, short form-like [Colletes gigas]
MVGYMPPMHVPLEPKWKHWPTYIYDVNYNYGINFYQPMIDYIDRKGRTSTTSRDYRYERWTEPPELPWSDGRALWEGRPVEPYSRRELIELATNAEDQAREHLSRFKIANRSDFSLSKTAQASHVTRELFPPRTREFRLRSLPLLVDSARIRSQARQIQREMAAIDLQALRDVQTMADVQSALDHGKSLRGKSARAIEFQLTAEAMKNLNVSQQLADVRKCQRENALWDINDTRLRLLEDRTRNLLDEERLAAPLDSLSRDLKGYEQKSSNYFLNKRYQDPTRPRRLYGCLG